MQPKQSAMPVAASAASPSIVQAKPSSTSSPAAPAPFSIRNSASAKRAREEQSDSERTAVASPLPAKNAPGSLLSRISRQDNDTSTKRTKLSTDAQLARADSPVPPTTQSRASLLSRIGSSTPSRPATPASPSPAPSDGIPLGLSIRARATDVASRSGLLLLGRSSSGTIPTTAAAPITQAAAAPTPVAQPAELIGETADNGPVRRKGRGFEQKELSDIVVQAQAQVAPWNPTPSPKQSGSAFAQQQRGGIPTLQARLQGLPHGPIGQNGHGIGHASGTVIGRGNPAGSLASRLSLGPR